MRKGPYDHQAIENKWQERWDHDHLYEVDLDHPKKKFYNLIMFPYPSAAALHVGHVYCYGGADTYARYKRMQGYDVFEPMGFDAFGIHAENYAITIKEHPQVVVPRNVEHFREDQMKKLGAMFDWSREVNTTDPDYYKWTQWVFLQMHRAGLVERKVAAVDWCPGCKTVLANEQVIDGVCERCHSQVEQKELAQWFFKITKYADRLLAGLDKIDWPERTKALQKNWIGKKTGASINYPVVGQAGKSITVFTTRPDTNFGATFVVLAPEHPLVDEITIPPHRADVEAYRKEVAKKNDMERTELAHEKTGVFTGAYCLNPLTGMNLPVWISDFVLSNFGTGAVVGVPAHDERDFAFAQKFGLPVYKVVQFFHELHVIVSKSYITDKAIAEARKQGLYVTDYPGGHKYSLVATKEQIQSLVSLIASNLIEDAAYAECDGAYTGIITKKGVIEGGDDVAAFAESHWIKENDIWIFNPGEYPFCYQGDGNAINSTFLDGLETRAAIEKVNDHLESNGWGKRTVSYRLHDWCVSRQRYWGPPIPMIHCEKCGWVPVPEKDLPVLLPKIDEYLPDGSGRGPLARVESFMKTECPVCHGPAERETDVSDTFLDSAWYQLRYPSTEFGEKPFDDERSRKWLPVDMYIGGIEHATMHLIYFRFVTMVLHDLGYFDFDEPALKLRHQGLIIKDGAKMSKSRGNVVNPDEYITKFGADAFRTYMLFIGPYEEGGEFNDRGILGASRFFEKVWDILLGPVPSGDGSISLAKLHASVKKVGEDFENLRFNTAIATLMELGNWLKDSVGTFSADQWKEITSTVPKLLAPLAPHYAEELWERLGFGYSIHDQEFPSFDASQLVESSFTMTVQVNGKVRDTFSLPLDVTQADAEKAALEREKVQKWLEGKAVKKLIYVPRKLISIVI